MARRILWTIVAFCLCLGGMGRAQQAATPDTAKLAGQIAPFLNSQTAVLVHFNLDQVDLDAASNFVTDALSKTAFPSEDLRELTDGLKQPKAVLKELVAFGFHDVYGVMGLELPTLGPPPVALIVPLSANANEANVRAALLEVFAIPELVGKSPEVIKLNDAMAMGSPQTIGDAKAIAGRGEAKLVDAMAMLKAMDSVGRHAVDVVIVPSADMRRVVSELMPKLPQEVGGASSEVVAQGMRYLAITLKLPPQPLLTARIQADSPVRAGELAAVWERVEKMLTASLVSAPPEIRPTAALLVTGLRPKVEEDRLTTTLEAATLGAMVQTLTPALHRARESAARATSMSRMKQLLTACVISASQHQGQWPDALDAALLAANGMPEAWLQNPRLPGQKPGYIYIKPRNGSTGAANLIVIYENSPAHDDGTAAGFADAHLEWMPAKTFQEAIKKQNAGAPPAK